MLLHFLYISTVSSRKPTLIFIFVLLYILCHFSLAAFKMVSLLLVLSNLILMSFRVVSFICLMVRVFFSLFHLYLLKEFSYLYILQLKVLLQLTGFFFFLFPWGEGLPSVFVSFLIVFLARYSRSRIFSSAMSNLLFPIILFVIPNIVFFICRTLINVFFNI